MSAATKYKHIKREMGVEPDLVKYQRTNQAYQDTFGTEKFMQSPYTLDVDETKVTARRSAFPDMRTMAYFSGDNYNSKIKNMALQNLVSARLKERYRPALQPSQIVDPEMRDMSDFTVTTDDTHIFLYLGAFVIGLVIFTSLL